MKDKRNTERKIGVLSCAIVAATFVLSSIPPTFGATLGDINATPAVEEKSAHTYIEHEHSYYTGLGYIYTFSGLGLTLGVINYGFQRTEVVEEDGVEKTYCVYLLKAAITGVGVRPDHELDEFDDNDVEFDNDVELVLNTWGTVNELSLKYSWTPSSMVYSPDGALPGFMAAYNMSNVQNDAGDHKDEVLDVVSLACGALSLVPGIGSLSTIFGAASVSLAGASLAGKMASCPAEGDLIDNYAHRIKWDGIGAYEAGAYVRLLYYAEADSYSSDLVFTAGGLAGIPESSSNTGGSCSVTITVHPRRDAGLPEYNRATFYPSIDTFVASSSPVAHESEGYLKVRNKDGFLGVSNFEERILIKFYEISDIPDEATIISAELKLYYYEYGGINPKGRELNCYRNTENWYSGTAWNTKPSYDYSEYSEAEVPDSTNSWMTWDVTDVVQRFVNGISNFGWTIRDTHTWGKLYIPRTCFRSSNYDGHDFDPKLEPDFPIIGT